MTKEPENVRRALVDHDEAFPPDTPQAEIARQAETIERLVTELAEAIHERDELREAVPNADAAYWQDRCLDHATALDKERIERARVESERERLARDLEQTQAVLREIKDNSAGQIEDPHFRHWTAVTIASYFSAFSALDEASDVFPQPSPADPPPASSESSHADPHRERLTQPGDTMQSAASRVLEWLGTQTVPEGGTPYEVSMAMVELRDAINDWTEARK